MNAVAWQVVAITAGFVIAVFSGGWWFSNRVGRFEEKLDGLPEAMEMKAKLVAGKIVEQHRRDYQHTENTGIRAMPSDTIS